MILPYHRELLDALQPTVAEITRIHVDNQQLWMPSELVPKDFVPQPISDSTAAMLVMNLLTEDGLPYFLSLLVHHLGDEGPLFDWSRIWTSEEDRHGAAIKLYLRAALSQEQFLAVERMQSEYLQLGFWPDWSHNPLRLIAYVVMQELATQLSHAGIANQARNEDPQLQLVMAKMSAEELRHHRVYFGFFAKVFDLDASEALDALSKVLGSFSMPGNQMPAFREIGYLQARLGVFGPQQLAEIARDVWKKLGIESAAGLSDLGESARDTIARQISTLERQAGRTAGRPSREVHLPFLGDTVVTV